MSVKMLTCIQCPRGCEMTVELLEEKVTSVKGNFCPKGATYARQEVVNPTRIVTSVIRLDCGEMISVKTDKEVPKSLILEVMKQIKSIKASAPIKIGDVLLQNVCGTSSNIIATKQCKI